MSGRCGAIFMKLPVDRAISAQVTKIQPRGSHVADQKPLSLFLGDAPDQLAAKVAQESRTGARNTPSASSAWKVATPTWACRI